MGSSNSRLAINLIDLLIAGVEMAPTVLAAYTQARNKLQQVVAEGREPTLEEHDELNALINNLRNDIHAPMPSLDIVEE